MASSWPLEWFQASHGAETTAESAATRPIHFKTFKPLDVGFTRDDPRLAKGWASWEGAANVRVEETLDAYRPRNRLQARAKLAATFRLGNLARATAADDAPSEATSAVGATEASDVASALGALVSLPPALISEGTSGGGGGSGGGVHEFTDARRARADQLVRARAAAAQAAHRKRIELRARNEVARAARAEESAASWREHKEASRAISEAFEEERRVAKARADAESARIRKFILNARAGTEERAAREASAAASSPPPPLEANAARAEELRRAGERRARAQLELSRRASATGVAAFREASAAAIPLRDDYERLWAMESPREVEQELRAQGELATMKRTLQTQRFRARFEEPDAEAVGEQAVERWRETRREGAALERAARERAAAAASATAHDFELRRLRARAEKRLLHENVARARQGKPRLRVAIDDAPGLGAASARARTLVVLEETAAEREAARRDAEARADALQSARRRARPSSEGRRGGSRGSEGGGAARGGMRGGRARSQPESPGRPRRSLTGFGGAAHRTATGPGGPAPPADAADGAAGGGGGPKGSRPAGRRTVTGFKPRRVITGYLPPSVVAADDAARSPQRRRD